MQLDWGEERAKTVTWHDPLAVAARGAQMAGREYLEAMRDGLLPPPPVTRLIDSRIVAIGDGEVTFACTPDESFYNPIGMIHGGLLCTLLDSVAGCAAHTLLPARAGYSSIEIKVNFIRAVHAGSGDITATGRVVKPGRRVMFAEAEAHDAAGKLVGSATSTLLISAAPEA